MDKIHIGVIGTGNIVHWMLSAMAKTEGIFCQAVYSRTEAKGRALAAEFGIPKVYTSLNEMLQDPEINFVYVASPNILHYEQAKLALEAGKHVICEKPFCPTLKQVSELVTLARKKGLCLIDAVPTAYLPNLEIVKENLHKIGRIRLVLCNYTQYSSRYDQFLAGQITNVFDAGFAGGALQDLNFYNVYFNTVLFGKPEDAIYFPNMLPSGTDGSGILIMRYPDFVSQATAAKDCKGYSLAMIEGEKGFIELKGGSSVIDQVRVVSPNGEELLNAQEHFDRWLYEVQGMVQHLKDDDLAYFDKQLDTTMDVIESMEQARLKAGILFPCDE